MRDLGVLGGPATGPSRAWGINELGQVVGVARTGVGTVSHAFLYTDLDRDGETDTGEMIDLDTSGVGDPNRFSQAFQINDAGRAVGEAVVGATPGGTSILHPVLWQDGTRLGLGTLGFTFGSALDINESGQVVGNLTNISGSPQAAFLWQAGVMTDLNSLIDPASGWVLRSAEAINDRGEIVGFGTFGGQTRAFLLSPVPEPASVACLASGVLVLIGRGRAARRRSR
jgi:probable HAF family extracellular repeat protein